jgi:hypothetical protein
MAGPVEVPTAPAGGAKKEALPVPLLQDNSSGRNAKTIVPKKIDFMRYLIPLSLTANFEELLRGEINLARQRCLALRQDLAFPLTRGLLKAPQ